jgi:hypothetical protein
MLQMDINNQRLKANLFAKMIFGKELKIKSNLSNKQIIRIFIKTGCQAITI